MANNWKPATEQRKHPWGESGVLSSLDEVAKAASKGSTDPRVRTWAIERLDKAREGGASVKHPHERARVLLEAVQKKLWVPDPIGAEYIPQAHLLACDPDKPKDGQVCVRGDDCFAEGTLVLEEERGPLPVEQLQPGMRIWGLDKWSVVQDVWPKGVLTVAVVHLSNGGRLLLTEDHHVYVVDPDGVEKRVRVWELRGGMRMPQPRYAPFEFKRPRSGDLRFDRWESGFGKLELPCWDITTDDHRVYLPEHDVTVSQCDGLATLLGACLSAVGIYTLIVGHGYGEGRIEHVLCAAHLPKLRSSEPWHYADPSTKLPLGRCVPFKRERLLSIPNVKVLCDGSTCLGRQSFDPDNLEFIEQGLFVGVGQPPELANLHARVVWQALGEAEPSLLEQAVRRLA